MPARIAITMGDPTGIGPETIASAWPRIAASDLCQPVVIGHPDIMRRASHLLPQGVHVVEVTAPEEAAATPTALPCIAGCDNDVLRLAPGQLDARGGRAAHDCVRLAADFALSGRVDGITTAPLNKEALRASGADFPGHTELLADICQVDRFAMMLYVGHDNTFLSSGGAGLGVVHVTLHMALRDVFHHLDPISIVSRTQLLHECLTALHGRCPRIGVCALNPHGGENGLFGDEEQRVIQPAIDVLRERGIDVTGPWPADTLMVRARQGEFDGVTAMYHDQGHIALKLLDWFRAVNVTLGLPIVRTSVAHGTAFDNAWKGTANSDGLVEAVRLAARLAQAPKPVARAL